MTYNSSAAIPSEKAALLRGILRHIADWPDPEDRTDVTRCPVSGALTARCRVLSTKESLLMDDLDGLIGFMVNGSEASDEIVGAFIAFFQDCGGSSKLQVANKRTLT